MNLVQIPLRYPAVHASLIIAACLAVLASVAFLDYMTGDEMTFSVFYVLPVAIASWRGGRDFRIPMAFLSAGAWIVVDHIESVHSHSFFHYWNTAVGLIFIVAIVVAHSVFESAHRRLKALSHSDSLTGLANRVWFFERAQDEIERARRSRQPLSLVYLDLDNFKQINDHLGHMAGDEFLHAVGDAIRRQSRKIDLVARLGGDEFAVLLPEEGPSDALVYSARILEVIRTELSQFSPASCSVGSVTFLTPPDSLEDMIHRADTLMYKVKTGGKNDICHEVVP